MVAPDRASAASDEGITYPEGDTFAEARILSYDGQLALGEDPHERIEEASHIRAGRSGSRKRTAKGRFKRLRNEMGKYPFSIVANQLLRETDPWYAQSTRDQRKRKFHRIHKALQELRRSGNISTTSPKNMTEGDVAQFCGWCKERLDDSTSVRYLKFLDEILQSAGNNSVKALKLKRNRNLPHPTAKTIRTIPLDVLDYLLHGNWELEDEWWNATGKAALALYAHSGMRSSEARLAKLADLSLERSEIVVSSPKGHRKWASGDEVAPIMPGALPVLRAYLETRTRILREKGLNPAEVEPLFPYFAKDGSVGCWGHQIWIRLKSHIELASGTKFKWKEMRPTFAQKSVDLGVPIEAVSKALRHRSTTTTEEYYARIRSESAFSKLRQAWEAPVVDNAGKISERKLEFSQ